MLLSRRFARILHSSRSLLAAAAILLLAGALLAPLHAEGERSISRTQEQVAQKVAALIENQHFKGQRIDDTVSIALFDEFFIRLDPEHMYFLQSDIDEFTPFRTVLDDTLMRKGQMDFAFSVFERFLQRADERIAYAEKRLAQPFDFTLMDDMELDRTESPWAQTSAELDGIWDGRLKNQMLIQQLVDEDRAAEEIKRRQELEAKGEDPNAKRLNEDGVEVDADGRIVLPGSTTKTPTEIVLTRYKNYQRWMHDKDGLDVMEMFLSTLTSIFDPHSTYWNFRTYEDFNIDMRLSFDGIGATLSSVDGYTMVVSIIPTGPAAQDGRLAPGDIITAVAQGDAEPEDVVNLPLDKVVRKIRGEKGTVVRLFVRKTLDDVPKAIDIVRGQVKLSAKEAKGEVRQIDLADGSHMKLGVIRLPGFYADAAALRRKDADAKTATGDVKRLLDEMLANDQIDGLVMDLRGNGGGYLFEAISLSGLFIPKGPVVQIRYPDALEVRDDEENEYYDLPLVVMVDRSTASASEIFAAAMQDYGRGIVIGDKSTHGKGTVQDVMDLARVVPSLSRANPGALKFTVAKYYRVNGGSTQQKGVEPDITLPNFRDHMEIGEAYLPHVMKWDEIRPLDIERTPHSVSRFIQPLTESSEARRAADAHFKELSAIIAYFEERRSRTHITLNKEKRQELRAQDEAWVQRRKDMQELEGAVDDMEAEGDGDGGAATTEDEADTPLRDLYLTESLYILGDLVRLSNDSAIAKESKDTTPAETPN